MEVTGRLIYNPKILHSNILNIVMEKIILILLLIIASAYARYQTVIIYKKCPICQGHGISICNSCSGTGKIKVYKTFSFDKKKPYRVEKCPKCGGLGYTGKCCYCGGSGKIKTDSITFNGK